LLVSNEYLVSLGISDFSSLRPKFVLTGAWVFLMYAFSSLPALLPALYMYRFGRDRRNVLRIVGIALLCIPIAIGLDLGWASVLMRSLHVWSLYWALPAVTWVLLVAFPWSFLSVFPEDAKFPHVIFYGALISISLLAFTYVMADQMYCHVPEAF